VSGCLITAILSSYNRPEGLRRSFESLNKQTIRDRMEIIICDDGSPNGEVHLLLDEYEKLPGIRTIRGEPRPVEHKKIYCTFTELINRAMDSAKGEYFCYLTDGNEYSPTACERNAEHLDGMPDVFLVWGMVQNIKNGDKKPTPPFGRLTPEYTENMLPKNNFVDHSSVMHRWTDIRWSTSPESWMYADWLYWRRLIREGKRFQNHGHHVLNFFIDEDSFGGCLIRDGKSFEETMALKMKDGDGKRPVKITKEADMKNRVKYAKNVGAPDRRGDRHPKIEIMTDGEEIAPGDLVLLEKVMTPRGNLFPAFIPFGEVPEYEPKRPPEKPPGVAKPAGPKVPFAGMTETVEAAKKRAEEMAKEAEEKPEPKKADMIVKPKVLADLEALHGKEAVDEAIAAAVPKIDLKLTSAKIEASEPKTLPDPTKKKKPAKKKKPVKKAAKKKKPAKKAARRKRR
jgi:glycosyltransferase involved in cell wall biosynthesis